MEIILATRNPSKALQIQQIFDGSGITVRTMDDTGVVGEAYEDEDTTFEDNALKKARYVREQAPAAWVMADDSGICIRAHDGAPGVNSAYWAGRDATTEEITRFVVEKMRGIEDRFATFHTFVAVIAPDGTENMFHGAVDGTLLNEPRVPAQPKMPYSPLFVPEGYEKCWAEMTTEEENAVSHRGKAFRAVRDFLRAL